MTLEEIKDSVELIVQSIDTEELSFEHGDEFIVSTRTSKYPLIFLEIPYVVEYDLARKQKVIQFALLVLLKSNPDDIEGDHRNISRAETIGDHLVSKIQMDIPGLKVLDNPNALSLREFSDDNLSGVRIELKITTSRTCG